MSIKWRLTAWYTSVLAVMLMLFGASIYGFVHFYTYGEVKNRLVEQAERIVNSKNFSLTQGLDFYLEPSQAQRLEDAQLYVQSHNYISGNSRFSRNMLDRELVFPVPDVRSASDSNGFQNMTVSGYSFIVYQVPIHLNGNIIGLVQLGAYTGAEDRLLERMKSILFIGGVISVVLASTFGLFLARKSMEPIGKVIEAANGIQTGNDLSVRIDYEGPHDEIGGLIGTVNSMLERMEVFYNNLDEAYSTQRRFVSDASHELRTPLTTIRGNVDLLKKIWQSEEEETSGMDAQAIRKLSLEAVTDIAGESERMSRLVNDMLSLARADAGQIMVKEMLPLEPLVEEVIRRAQFLPRNATWIQGDMSMLGAVSVNGNKDYLQQMLFIFIENAFKYTPSGSVTMDVIRAGEQIGLRISDTGIGMDRSEVPHIFERFYRADPSRGVTPGTGLGLSIAKWIIDEHEGSVEVFTRLGEGTTFVIWLPAVFHALPE